MAYKYGNREQITFLPESIESYVTDEDPVRVYDAFIDALDLKELGVDVDEDAPPSFPHHVKSTSLLKHGLLSA